jgi:hypothetical protein
MKRYRVTGKILLSFIFFDQQEDILIDPHEGDYIASNGKTVWYFTHKGDKYESITTANVIDVALERGDIIEII